MVHVDGKLVEIKGDVKLNTFQNRFTFKLTLNLLMTEHGTEAEQL